MSKYTVHTGLYGLHSADFAAFPEALAAYSEALTAWKASGRVPQFWEKPDLTGEGYDGAEGGFSNGLTADEIELKESIE